MMRAGVILSAAAAWASDVQVRKDCQALRKPPEIVHADQPYKAFGAELLAKLKRVRWAQAAADYATTWQ